MKKNIRSTGDKAAPSKQERAVEIDEDQLDQISAGINPSRSYTTDPGANIKVSGGLSTDGLKGDKSSLLIQNIGFPDDAGGGKIIKKP